MKTKEKIYTLLLTLLAIFLVLSNYFTNKYIAKAENVYAIYLDGTIIGYIADDKELYNIINERQKDIMKKYKVKKVYPPNNFKIVRMNTYNAVLSNPDDIYGEMTGEKGFAIEGYKLIIKSEGKEKEIYFLDKNVLDDSIKEFVKAFVTEEEYNNFMNNTQRPIETTGKIIDLMYFEETLSTKKSLVNLSEKIYTDKIDLTQYFLFGENRTINTYTVKEGDTIKSISNNNKLNTKEFLIANPRFKSEDSLLAVGDKVNITLIKPEITFTYEATEVADTEVNFEKKTIYDNTKPSNYSEISVPGVKGITRISQQYIVKNGVIQSGVKVNNAVPIIAKVDQVTIRGRNYVPNYGRFGIYTDDGTDWAWPTNPNYVITSSFDWRWGVYHEGIDISGTGYGSPIYSVAAGVVRNAGWGGMVGSSAGYNVVIEHPNGYWSVYAHLSNVSVSLGQEVGRKQIVGGMGATGKVTGYHLHFSICNGEPYNGGKFFNPMLLWQ